MLNIILEIVYILGLFVLVFISPACMNVGLVRMSNKGYTIGLKEYLLCCIPVFNHFYGWNRYSGSIISLSGISSIVLYLMLLVRYTSMTLYFENEAFQLYTVYGFLLSVILFWVLSAIDVYRVMEDSSVYTLAGKVFNSFNVITGQIIVGYYIPRKMRYYFNKQNKGVLYERS